MLALDECMLLDLWGIYPDVMLWCTVLGGVVSEQTDLRDCFVEMAERAYKKVDGLAGRTRTSDSSAAGRSPSRSHQQRGNQSGDLKLNPKQEGRINVDTSWTVVREICTSFLWFDGSECDGAGRAFWHQVGEIVHSRGGS